jgi:GT2 family glycosyltransferase
MMQPEFHTTSTPPVGVVGDCDVASGIDAIPGLGHAVQLMLVVRVFTEPIGVIERTLPPSGLSSRELADQIASSFEAALRERLDDAGVAWLDELPTSGLTPRETPRFLATRTAVVAAAPEMTVAVCTRDRPDDLANALSALLKQEHRPKRILVVDNASSSADTQRLVSALSKDHDHIDYVSERRPGLSWARNRAISETETEVIAWFDDDAICDQWWTTEIVRGFVEEPTADVTTGPLVPMELLTESQVLFERYSGASRGRGFTRAVFSRATQTQSPMYPLPPYGIGANMAFRRRAFDRIGMFDTALGAGTLTLAGEDTAAFSRVLLSGGSIVYQPSALVKHRHRRDADTLKKLMLGYGRGLTAFYASMLAEDPRRLFDLIRLAPQALRDQMSTSGERLQELDDFPKPLLRANRVGLMQGAFLYPVARVRAKRLASSSDRAQP